MPVTEAAGVVSPGLYQRSKAGMTLATDPLGDAPTADAIRAQVDCMVSSDTFNRSPQLGAFLRFVVEAVLHGKSDRIKAYTIGVEVLRRSTSFDPQLDPIVRVEATRLRRAIGRYYAGPGASDPVIIDLPRGSYVPTFRRRTEDDQLAVDGDGVATSGRGTPRFRLAAALVAMLVLVVMGVFVWQQIDGPSSGDALSTAEANGRLGAGYPGSGMPVLAVEPFETTGMRRPRAISDSGLYQKLRDAFVRFDTVNVLATQPRPGASGTPPARADYVLRGGVDYLDDGTTTVRLRLIDHGNGAVVWSSTSERIVATRDHDAVEESIVLATAGTLVQPFGVIHTRARVKHLASSAGDPRYRCVIEASESLRSFDPQGHASARTCLEQLTADAPSFVVGLRYLAAIYLREYLYGLGSSPATAATLDQALRTSRRAVELHPEGSRAYNTLGSVQFARREFAQAFAASERAVALNKYDMAVLGDFGGRLIAAGQIDRGMTLLRRAAAAGTVRPAPHHFYLFLGLYMTGDMPGAAAQAAQLTGVTYPLGVVARILAAQATGDRDKARSLIDALVAAQPGWRDDPRGQLAKFFPEPAIVDRLTGDLAIAGLGGRS
jgi:TolB-like protein